MVMAGDLADQDSRDKLKERLKKSAEKAQERTATPEQDLSAVIDTNQQILIRNMRTAIEASSLKGNSITTLRNPGLNPYTKADLISYWGPPEDLNNKMVKGPDGKHFVHATQAQLSVLEPLLRFFIVNKDGSEREVYFSDYTSEERLLKLASASLEKESDPFLFDDYFCGIDLDLIEMEKYDGPPGGKSVVPSAYISCWVSACHILPFSVDPGDIHPDDEELLLELTEAEIAEGGHSANARKRYEQQLRARRMSRVKRKFSSPREMFLV